MRQGIEIQHEMSEFEVLEAAGFSGGKPGLCVRESRCMCEKIAPQPGVVAVGLLPCAGPVLLHFQSSNSKTGASRRRTRSQSSARTKKFFAEGPLARSVWSVLRAIPNRRDLKVASPLITPMTEQRRCEAA